MLAFLGVSVTVLQLLWLIFTSMNLAQPVFAHGECDPRITPFCAVNVISIHMIIHIIMSYGSYMSIVGRNYVAG